jgi:hypothetical protein
MLQGASNNLLSYDEAKARLDLFIQDGNYTKVFDISTVEKQMEFQIFKDGKYVSVDGGDLLTDLKQ